MRAGPDIVGIGYSALDYLAAVPRLPEENTKLELGEIVIQGGGPAATATVTAARLGFSAAFIGKVSDDDFGRRMLEELGKEDVDISSVVVEPGYRSQFAFILVDEKTAARTILWNRGTLPAMTAEDVDEGLIASCGGLLLDSMEPRAGAAAAKLAKERGIPVVIDAGTLREGIGEILPYCSHIVASELFAGQISGGRGVGAALEKIDGFGPRASVVTLGERGCVALESGRVMEIEGFDVDAVDTTGAGDVFHGAFIFGVMQGWDIRRICVFSNAVAALKCMKMGGRAGIPDLGQALRFLSRRMEGLDFPVSRRSG